MKLGIDLTFLGESFGGGKDQFIYNLLAGWQEQGWADELVLFLYPHTQDRIRELVPTAQVVVVEERFSWMPKKLARDLWFRTFVLPGLVQKQGVDALFFPQAGTGFRRLSVPTAVNPHDIQFIEYPERAGLGERLKTRLLYTADFRLRDIIVAISDYDRSAMAKHFPDQAGKLVRIYNPIRFGEEKQLEKPLDPPVILAVNIGFVHKNTETLIQAFERVADRITHDLILVGNLRPETAHLRTLVSKSPWRYRMRLTGYLNEQELGRLYAGSDLFVTPSLYEGFGMPPVEAMGQGVAVVSSRETALPEATLERAFYYEPALSAEALGARILAVLGDPPDQETLIRIGNEVRARYDYRQIAAEYRAFFVRLTQPERSVDAGVHVSERTRTN